MPSFVNWVILAVIQFLFGVIIELERDELKDYKYRLMNDKISDMRIDH